MDQQKIGKFIAELRKEKNLTQEELASQLGITKNAVSKWERGISLMDMSQLKPLCEILEISILELLNGERIEKDSLRSKTDEVIKNTFDYTNKRIKKNRRKNILLTIIVLVIGIITIFLEYKYCLVWYYTIEKNDTVEKYVKGLKNPKTINIYKRTIEEDDYLVINNFKIRNDFEGFIEEERHSDLEPITYKKKENDKNIGISFRANLAHYQLIDAFTSDDTIFVNGNDFNITGKFNAADRKYFLLKNDINNDLDFYLYMADNYYKKNNIFMDKRTLMENYAFNVFTEISISKIDSMTIIKGDYEGYIFKNGQMTEVIIIRDGKRYGFLTNIEKFQNEDYLIDILGTIEIR